MEGDLACSTAPLSILPFEKMGLHVSRGGLSKVPSHSQKGCVQKPLFTFQTGGRPAIQSKGGGPLPFKRAPAPFHQEVWPLPVRRDEGMSAFSARVEAAFTFQRRGWFTFQKVRVWYLSKGERVPLFLNEISVYFIL